MLLHHNPASPFVRMVRVVAHETGQIGDIQTEVAAVLPIERHEAISSANPLGRIPALVTDEGQGIYDSRVICAYLAHRAGDGEIHPSTDFRVMTLFALAQGLCDSAVNLRYETALRPEDLRWDQWMARQNERIFAVLDDLEANWQSELTGVHVGSIGVAVALAYLDFRYSDLGWRDGRNNLSAFYDSFSQRPSMQDTKPE